MLDGIDVSCNHGVILIPCFAGLFHVCPVRSLKHYTKYVVSSFIKAPTYFEKWNTYLAGHMLLICPKFYSIICM